MGTVYGDSQSDPVLSLYVLISRPTRSHVRVGGKPLAEPLTASNSASKVPVHVTHVRQNRQENWLREHPQSLHASYTQDVESEHPEEARL